VSTTAMFFRIHVQLDFQSIRPVITGSIQHDVTAS